MRDDLKKLTGEEELLPVGGAAKTTALARRKRPQTAPKQIQTSETVSFRVYQDIINKLRQELSRS
tara:strand:+ start:547 stop:741 length:195 start_codon:yes stop_codon:yes gene_type:complete